MQYLCEELEHVKQSVTRLECTVDLLQNMLFQKRKRKVHSRNTILICYDWILHSRVVCLTSSTVYLRHLHPVVLVPPLVPLLMPLLMRLLVPLLLPVLDPLLVPPLVLPLLISLPVPVSWLKCSRHANQISPARLLALQASLKTMSNLLFGGGCACTS